MSRAKDLQAEISVMENRTKTLTGLCNTVSARSRVWRHDGMNSGIACFEEACIADMATEAQEHVTQFDSLGKYGYRYYHRNAVYIYTDRMGDSIDGLIAHIVRLRSDLQTQIEAAKAELAQLI
jgi:hypothetical protein